MPSLASWLRAVLGAAVTIALAALAMMAVAVLAGAFRLDVITSDSMEPTYSVGDLVVLVPTDAQRIVEGDVVALRSENLDATVAHRVADIDRETGTVRLQGDANDGLDPEVYDLADAPRVVFAVPQVGAPIYAAQANPVAFGATAGVLVAVLLLVWHLVATRQRNKPVPDTSTPAGSPHTLPVQHLDAPFARSHK